METREKKFYVMNGVKYPVTSADEFIEQMRQKKAQANSKPAAQSVTVTVKRATVKPTPAPKAAPVVDTEAELQDDLQRLNDAMDRTAELEEKLLF